jgi:glucosylceramidase
MPLRGIVFLAGLLLLPTLLKAQTVRVVQTTSDLQQVLAPAPDLHFEAVDTALSPANLTLIVDDTMRYQTMDGFGASLTDGSAWLLHDRLDTQTREKVMAQLFDPQHGIGLSFLRQPIGASDLSREESSFDDMPAGQQDPMLAHFSVKHDEAYIFPMVREALQLNPAITVMATPWSPPGWMKTRPTMDGGSLRDNAMAVYAAYLTQSVEAFQAAGVPVRYLTVQNEPLHDTTDFPGTLMPAAQAKRLIGQYLGPDLRRAGLKTEILAYDHNWDHIEYPAEELSDPAAAPFLAGSALHCYGGNAGAQTTLHDEFPNKGIWLTECSGGTWQRESPLFVTSHLLIDATRNWAKSVVLWGIALDTDHNPHTGGCGTCRGLVTIDLQKNPAMVTYTGDFYAMGHASKFVHPQATRIGSSSPGRDSLESVAFQNPDRSIALLVLNNQSSTQEFSISWHGRSFHTSLLAKTLATYLWPGAG